MQFFSILTKNGSILCPFRIFQEMQEFSPPPGVIFREIKNQAQTVSYDQHLNLLEKEFDKFLLHRIGRNKRLSGALILVNNH